MEPSLSLVVPIYNEEENLEQLISDIKDYFSGLQKDHEIIFVDDGSSDQSSRIIENRRDEQIKLISHATNRGYGEALKTGFENAEKELIAYIDGDGQFDVKDIDKMLEFFPGTDMVIGERRDRKDGTERIVVSRGFNTLVRKTLDLDFRDIDCGIKIFRRGLLDEIDLSTKRTVDAELVAKAYHRGFKITQVEVDHYERKGGESEAEGLIGVRSDLILTSLKEIVQIRFELEK
jgi:glycosyltransferase involved in cell wall biosynthesis